MAKCPFCSEELSDAEVQARLCMSCGKPLPSSAPRDEEAGAGKAQSGDTTERIAETIDGHPPIDPEQPPEDARHAATVGAGGGFVSPEEQEPKPDPRLAETVQTDKQFVLPNEDQTPPPPKGDAAAPSGKQGDTAHGRRIAATIPDVGDLPHPPAGPKQPPDDAQADRLAATLDSGQFGLTPPPTEKDSGPTPDDIAATMDPGNSGRFAQTMNSGDSARFAEVLKSGDSSRFDQTTESGDSSRFAMTLGSGSVDSMLEERVSVVWSGTFQPETTPRTSIKAEAQSLESQAHIVIKPRVMAQSAEPAGARADYQVVDKLGEGGMGVVYAARQASIDRTVAVKMLKPNSAENREERGKFLSEAIVTGDLEHPNIVPIYDLGKREDGALFYSMKRVKGTPWDSVIQERSFAENVEILQKVADAVGFAHSRSVVHRDLKPENVMLGDFGEVLLMDWGLALSQAADPSTTGMGGTPAYMAPEMATGPVDAISGSADIYLLGAILYEIITGRPPHTGKTVMDCLFAAARNEIFPVPEGKDGREELIAIAQTAMATDPTKRHGTVVAFQDAIREYQSHSESISLSTRADEDLTEAGQTKSYETFAKARFGFQEAFELWEGNDRAKVGVTEASLAYAGSALEKGDFDLGLSLLDPKDPQQAELAEKLTAAQRERDERQQRLKTYRRIGIALVALVFVVIIVAFFLVAAQMDKANKARARAEEQKKVAEEQKQIAETKEKEALEQKGIADQKTTEALTQKKIADEKTAEALAQKKIADEQTAAAVAQKKVADAQRAKAVKAREKEEYGAYIARIGLAAAKIEENAFEKAAELLELCPAGLRDWEWGRLRFLCTRDISTFQANWPLECVAFSPDGKRFATAGWEGKVHIANIDTDQKAVRLGGGELAEIVLDTGGDYVFDLAFSPDGKYLATGGNSRPHYVQVWDANTGQLLHQLAGANGHTDTVISVAFSQKGAGAGQRLLTGSYDGTARLWDWQNETVVRVFTGHDWWVWSAAFSPDEKRIVTASQDGSAMVWDVDSGEPGPPFLGHQAPVYAAAFSPDGGLVATAGYDNRVLIWNPDEVQRFDISSVVSGESSPEQKYRVLEGHSAAVRSVEFSQDGKLLVTGSNDNTIHVWDVASGESLKILRGHAGRVPACVFSPDGKHVVSASHDRTAKRWNIEGYREVRVFKGHVLEGHRDEILGAAFSPQGDRVVTASRDRSAKIWDPADGQELDEFKEGHEFLASTVLFFPGSKRIVTAATDNTARIWDIASGTELIAMEHTGPSAAVALSHDGTWLLTGSDAKEARIWDAETGDLLHTLGGHGSEVSAVAVSPGPDNQWILTADAAGRCILWDAKTRKVKWEQAMHSRGISAAHFLPSGDRVLTSSLDNTVSQWDVKTGEEIRDLRLVHPDAVTALAIAPDGRRGLTVCADRIVRLWDLHAHTVLHTLAIDRPADEDSAEAGAGRDGAATSSERASRQGVSAISFDSTGRQAITVSGDNRVRLWQVTDDDHLLPAATGDNVIVDLSAGGGLVWSAIFSPKGDYVVTVGGDEARLWDLATRQSAMRFSPHGSVASANFSPDGRRVVTGSWDNTARIWDVDTGRSLLKLEGDDGHTKYVNSAVFSSDGSQVVTASDDRTIKIWNADSGECNLTLTGHEDRVRTARFSPDGLKVLSSSNDNTTRIWDAKTGKCLTTLHGHSQAVLDAAFSNDGSLVITAGEDNEARMWHAATGEPVMIAAADVDEGMAEDSEDSADEPDADSATPGEDDPNAGQNATDEPPATDQAGLPLATLAASLQGPAPQPPSKDDATPATDAPADDNAGPPEPFTDDEPVPEPQPLILTGHTAAVTSVAFSPDDSRVVTGSADGTAKIWDILKGNEILTLKGHSEELTAVAFSPGDGQTVLTGSRDGTCILWLTVDWKENTAGNESANSGTAVAASARTE